MKVLVLILSIIIFIKTTSYGVYELKENNNKTGGIVVISIAVIAPLGLALYWLMNNILMIIERIILNKFMNKEEETNNV